MQLRDAASGCSFGMQPRWRHRAKLTLHSEEKINSYKLKAGICMDILIRALITFVVVLLVLYLVNMLPIDGRAKQIVRVIVIIIGVPSLLGYVVNF
jgi:hypothetical protein